LWNKYDGLRFGFKVFSDLRLVESLNHEDLLLKFINEDKAKVVVGEVHEDVCRIHQFTPKMW
jgi:hypothetical protein